MATRASRPVAATTSAAERLAQPGHVYLDALPAVRGVDCGHSSSMMRAVGTTASGCSSRSAKSARCFPAPELQHALVLCDLQRAQEPELHRV